MQSVAHVRIAAAEAEAAERAANSIAAQIGAQTAAGRQ
jgi:hypothetical protein